MGKRYLIDSNAIIDFFNTALPAGGIEFFLKIDPAISIITQIEIFSKKGLYQEEIENLNDFIKSAAVYLVDKDIAIRTIGIRLQHKIKLPDAIIAATALHYNLKLLTRNTADFTKIAGLEVINPHTV